MDDLKRLAALSALNDMMAKGYVNICTIDKVGELLGINPKLAADAYLVLHTLHCVNFDKMPPALRDQVPALVEQVLSVLPTTKIRLVSGGGAVFETTEAVQHAEKRPLLRRLGLAR